MASAKIRGCFLTGHFFNICKLFMPTLRLLLLILLGLAPVICPHAAQPIFPEKIVIASEAIPHFEMENPSRTRFGSLEFRGGLVLTSSNKDFGGLSALRVQRDGSTFLALSDRAFWLRGRILYRNQHPIGITDSVLSHVLDAGGIPAIHWDTESLAQDGGALYVGIEGINSIARFDYGKQQLQAPGRFINTPPSLKSLPRNRGLEALVFVPKPYPLAGALLAISERGLTDEGNIKAFIIGGPHPGTFSLKRSDDYDISDAALLPDGDPLILERYFSLLGGFACRIRRLSKSEIKPGAILSGRILFEADMRCQIDNMEALSVHRDSSGELILTLLSDDNNISLQRTLLLQFLLRKP